MVCFMSPFNIDKKSLVQMLQNPSKQGHLSHTLNVSKLPKSVPINKSRTPTSSTPREGLVPQYLMKNRKKQRAGGNFQTKKDLKKQVFVCFCQIQKPAYLASKKMAQRKTTTNHNQKFGSLIGELYTSFSFQIPCQRFLFWSIPSSVPACRYGESLLLSHHSLEVPAGVVKFGDPP